MVDDPPSLEPPTARKRLIDTFGPIDTWGEHGPEAMQAILDALDTETVPAVDSLDALENISDTDIPYVIKGNDQSPGELSDQAIPTGKQLKSLSEAVSNQVESVANAKLDSVESINDISEPADDDRFYVAELGATVKYDESSDSYGLESVPVVSTADELDEFDTSGIPHVIAGNETAPEELSDQVVSTGAHLKAVLNSVTSEIDSITDAKLTSVESVSDISEPADNERFYVVNLATTVRYDASSGKYEIEGLAKVDGTSVTDLPNPDQFTAGSRIETRGNGETWRVQA